VLDREIKRIRNGRVLLIPESPTRRPRDDRSGEVVEGRPSTRSMRRAAPRA
jgi:hypothetical protein